MKKLFLTITALCLCFFALFATSCSSGNEVKTNCQTGWNVLQYYKVSDDAETEKELDEQYVCFNVTIDYNINEIWLNIGASTVDSVTLTFGRYSTAYLDQFLTNKETYELVKSEVLKTENGWVRIKDGYNQTSSYIKISLTGGVKIDEVVLLDTKGKVMPVSVYGGKVIYADESGRIFSQDSYTRSELEKLELSEGSPLLLIDEQDKFSK